MQPNTFADFRGVMTMYGSTEENLLGLAKSSNVCNPCQHAD
jgi:hypothetical protein